MGLLFLEAFPNGLLNAMESKPAITRSRIRRGNCFLLKTIFILEALYFIVVKREETDRFPNRVLNILNPEALTAIAYRLAKRWVK
jgi:hypothetical protein